MKTKIKTVKGWKTPREILSSPDYLKKLIERFRKYDLTK